jgi:RNA recognition motif-containing protein
LNPETTDHDLITQFSVFGRVVKCRVPCHPQSRIPKQVAYIQFDNQQSADEAIRHMNGSELHGRYIRVSVARAWEDRPPSYDDRRGSRNRRHDCDGPPRLPPPAEPFFHDFPPFVREPPPFYRDDPYFGRPFRGPPGFDSLDTGPVGGDLARMLLAQAADRWPEPTSIEDAIRQELDRREAAESMKNSDERILEIFRRLRE